VRLPCCQEISGSDYPFTQHQNFHVSPKCVKCYNGLLGQEGNIFHHPSALYQISTCRIVCILNGLMHNYLKYPVLENSQQRTVFTNPLAFTVAIQTEIHCCRFIFGGKFLKYLTIHYPSLLLNL